MSASAVIADVRSLLAGEPAFLAGSLVAAETYGLDDAYSDVDVFCPTSSSLMAIGSKLLGHGYTLDTKFERVWYRWLRYDFNKWHTNSLRLLSPLGHETNLVYKMTDGHPTTSLSQVLESFDFGLLGVGYNLELNKRMDLRPFLFEGFDIDGPLPMMPNKQGNWRAGFISRYNGLREMGRYAKYVQYGYDLTLVKDDLVTGYYAAAGYFTSCFEAEKQQLGQIYESIAMHITNDDVDEMVKAAKEIDYNDQLDVIMEALE